MQQLFAGGQSPEQASFRGSSGQSMPQLLQAFCGLCGFLQELTPVIRRMTAGQHRLEHPVGIALAAVGALGVGVIDPAQHDQP